MISDVLFDTTFQIFKCSKNPKSAFVNAVRKLLHKFGTQNDIKFFIKICKKLDSGDDKLG